MGIDAESVPELPVLIYASVTRLSDWSVGI